MIIVVSLPCTAYQYESLIVFWMVLREKKFLDFGGVTIVVVVPHRFQKPVRFFAAAISRYSIIQSKIHTGMTYTGVTQRCCPGLLLCQDNKKNREF